MLMDSELIWGGKYQARAWKGGSREAGHKIKGKRGKNELTKQEQGRRESGEHGELQPNPVAFGDGRHATQTHSQWQMAKTGRQQPVSWSRADLAASQPLTPDSLPAPFAPCPAQLALPVSRGRGVWMAPFHPSTLYPLHPGSRWLPRSLAPSLPRSSLIATLE